MIEPHDPLFPVDKSPTLSITPSMKEDMRVAARWSQVVAISGMAINGLLCISMFLIIGFTFFMMPTAVENNSVQLMGISYALFSLFNLFYIYISVLLYRYSNHLSKYTAVSTQSAFESFFEHQERFWKIFGGSMAFFVVFYLFGIVAFGVFIA